MSPTHCYHLLSFYLNFWTHFITQTAEEYTKKLRKTYNSHGVLQPIGTFKFCIQAISESHQ